MNVECRQCGRTLHLKRDPDDLDKILIEALSGWTFTIETGWICGDHKTNDKEGRR